MAISVVSFSFSRFAQPEAQRPTLQGAGFLYCMLSPTGLQTPSGVPRAPSAWCGFPYHISSLTCLISNSSSPSYIIVQSPTQSLEWHVWSSSSRNNCHAIQRSLSSGASVYECIMGFYLVPFRQPNPPTRFLSITGHWNVSLPSSASLWNGMFGRVEGHYTTRRLIIQMLRLTIYKNMEDLKFNSTVSSFKCFSMTGRSENQQSAFTHSPMCIKMWLGISFKIKDAINTMSVKSVQDAMIEVFSFLYNLFICTSSFFLNKLYFSNILF